MWTYKVAVDWKKGKTGESRCAGKPTVEVATPPEFGGPENIWTPEDLLTSAVATCIMTSALFFLERSKITLKNYQSNAEATMEKGPTGLVITGITVAVTVEIEDPAQTEATQKAILQAEKTCPLSNSLNCPVTLEVQII
ncbi:MAG: OsmC family protein [Pontiellaceae bacterium]|nr:OsmC family protein [Pontiellaceae bacterium]MBN2785485.1 OsmC family protein [Pontiellaceae bacterium]